MNILILANHMNTGGISTYVLTLGEGLVQSGHKVWVMSADGDCRGNLDKVGVVHVPVGMKLKSGAHPLLWLNLPTVVRFIKQKNIHIIHAQTRVTSVLSSVASLMTGIPFISTCHGFFSPKLSRLLFPCWGKAVIAISKPVKEHLETGFNVPSDRIVLIPNGINVQVFKPIPLLQRQQQREARDMQGNPMIGIIARLSSVKGIDVLIAAMPSVLQQYPQACLWIVGQGDQEAYLKECVRKHRVESSVQFFTHVQESRALLPLFDVFVMPSIQEGLGLSVIEAQACGVPVVASKVGGLVDLIEDGKTGFLVEPRDHLALAKGIMAILKDPQRAASMAVQARRQVESRFNAQDMVNATYACYEQYSRR